MLISIAEPTPGIEPWDLLQEPPHASEVDPGFRLLLSALDTGWRIEEPVYLRPRWSERGPRVYHFILQSGALSAGPRLVTVPVCPEVERFIRHERLHVVIAKTAF